MFEDFIRSGKYLKSWSPKTERSYRQAYSSFQASLAARIPAVEASGSPCKTDLEAWVVWMKQKGFSNGGINCYLRAMNSFLSWLKSEEVLPTSLRIKLLPNPPKPLRGFSDLEIRSLLSFRPRGFTQIRTWTLVNTLLDTGCRIDELLGCLKASDVNFDECILTVSGKGSKKRHVPFSLELRKLLFRYKMVNVKTHNGNFFCTRDGARLSYRNTYRDIKNLCAKAGVVGEHVHPHAMRHCFATTYIRRGGDIYRLSRILGHTSISTTQIYLRSMGIEQIGENHSSLSPLSKIS